MNRRVPCPAARSASPPRLVRRAPIDAAKTRPDSPFRRPPHDFGHDPMVLAEAPGAAEPLVLEHRDRAIVQERCRYRPAFRRFGVAFHRSSAQAGDLPERALEGGRGDALAAIPPVDEEAGD